MEAHIVPAEEPVDNTGDDMLSGMLLHQVKPTFPVDAPLRFPVHRQRSVAQMEHLLLFLPDRQHPDTAQSPQVASLTASFGIKGCPVQ